MVMQLHHAVAEETTEDNKCQYTMSNSNKQELITVVLLLKDGKIFSD